MTKLVCPNCGLLNPPSAIRCDCGYDFKLGQVGESYIAPKQLRNEIKAQRGRWFSQPARLPISPLARRFVIWLLVLVIVPNVALLLAIFTHGIWEGLDAILGGIAFFHGVFYHIVPGLIIGEPIYKVSVVLAPAGLTGWIISITFYVVLSFVLAVLIRRRR